MFDTVLHIDTETAALISGVVIANVLTPALTRLTAPSWVKALLTFLLTVTAAFITLAAGPDGVTLREYVPTFVETFAAGIISYYGLGKHTVANVVALKTRSVGVGGEYEAKHAA